MAAIYELKFILYIKKIHCFETTFSLPITLKQICLYECYICYIFGVIKDNKYSLLWYESAQFYKNHCPLFIRISTIKRDDRRAQSARMNANID